MLVDNGSMVNIIYLNVYKRMGQTKSELSLTTWPHYGFIGDHVIPKGTIKLAITVGEHPRVSMVMTDWKAVVEGSESSDFNIPFHNEVPNS